MVAIREPENSACTGGSGELCCGAGCGCGAAPAPAARAAGDRLPPPPPHLGPRLLAAALGPRLPQPKESVAAGWTRGGSLVGRRCNRVPEAQRALAAHAQPPAPCRQPAFAQPLRLHATPAAAEHPVATALLCPPRVLQQDHQRDHQPDEPHAPLVHPARRQEDRDDDQHGKQVPHVPPAAGAGGGGGCRWRRARPAAVDALWLQARGASPASPARLCHQTEQTSSRIGVEAVAADGGLQAAGVGMGGAGQQLTQNSRAGAARCGCRPCRRPCLAACLTR